MTEDTELQVAETKDALNGENVEVIDSWANQTWSDHRRATLSLGKGAHCSGVMISPYHLLTAAHCVIDQLDPSYPILNNDHIKPGHSVMKTNDRGGWYPMSFDHHPPSPAQKNYTTTEVLDTDGDRYLDRFKQQANCTLANGWPWPTMHKDKGPGWTGLDAELCAPKGYFFNESAATDDSMVWRWQQELWWDDRHTTNDAARPLQEGLNLVAYKEWPGYMWFRSTFDHSRADFYHFFTFSRGTAFEDMTLTPALSIYDFIPNWTRPQFYRPAAQFDGRFTSSLAHLQLIDRFDGEADQGKFSTPAGQLPADAAVSAVRVSIFDADSSRLTGQAYSVYPGGTAIGEINFSSVQFDMNVADYASLIAGQQQTPYSLVPGAPDKRVRVIALFGGENAAGTLSNTLWIGALGKYDQDGVPYIAWNQIDAPTDGPIPRKDAMLAYDDTRKRVVLFGGEGGNGVINDLWQFDLGARAWSTADHREDLPALAGATPVQIGNAAFMVGGRNNAGIVSSVYLLDFSNDSVSEFETTDGFGKRSGMVATLGPNGDGLYAYGGTDEAGNVHTDLWSLDVTTKAWTLVIPENPNLVGPDTSSSPLLIPGRLRGGDLLVYPGESTDDATYWKAGEGAWITKKECEPLADYDGDGVPNGHTCDMYPDWEVTAYSGGDLVSHNGGVYQCKPWPYSGWCGVNEAYEPGRGAAWSNAWDFVIGCEEEEVGTPMCSSLPEWSLGSYTSGDQIAADGNVYECKGWAYMGWCGASEAYAPPTGWAWQNAWTLVGPCN